MSRIYKFFASIKLVVIFLLFVLLFSLYLFPASANSYTIPGESTHFHLQMQRNKEGFTEVVAGWGDFNPDLETAIQNYRTHLVRLDFIFPIIYMCFLLSVIAVLTNTPGEQPAGRKIFLFLLPLGAGLFDIAENLTHLVVLKDVSTIEDLQRIPENQIQLSFFFTVAKLTLILLPLVIAIAIKLYRMFFWMEKQTKNEAKFKASVSTRLSQVLAKERAKIINRRKQAAHEFTAVTQAQGANKLSPAEEKYKQALESGERGYMGLAFSGGGIRSATFNLGLLQALGKYRILPWVDYLTSVSGGGFTASCMTTLLSLDEKAWNEDKGRQERLYYHFNTQWERFPFNPTVQAFDRQGIAHEGESQAGIAPPLKKGTNKQLKYMRNQGNYLIPRMGFITRDTLRGIGATIIRISYTVLIFLLLLLTFSGFHYAVSAALTPNIRTNFDLSPVEVETKESPESSQKTDVHFEGQEEKTEQKEFSLFYLIFGDYEENPATVPMQEKDQPIPLNLYGIVLGVGFVISLLVGIFLTNFYKDDPTLKYKLRGWKVPENFKKVTKETYVAIKSLKIFSGGFYFILLVLTLLLWISRYSSVLSAGHDALTFYCALIPWLLVFIMAGGWFVGWYFEDYNWVDQGLDEQLRIDTLAIYTVLGSLFWAMTLTVAELRFRAFLAVISGPQIFWIWLPAVFFFGSLLGLATLRLIPLKHYFHVRKGAFYEDSIGRLGKFFYNQILDRDQDFKPFPANNDITLRPSVWSNAEYRSSFWALQGLLLYGITGCLVMGLLALPHYFSVLKDSGEPTLIPLAVSILSAGWASLISSVIRNQDSKPSNLLVRVLALPAGMRNFALGFLVVLMILAIILGMETLLDGLTVGQAYLVAAIAFITLAISGRVVDYNYITPHYFFRDRMADGFMKTEVESDDGQVVTVRDDRLERLNWITPTDCSAPYHIVQTTLNLPGSWHMRFKDRKSDVFILSKDYCGSELTDYVSTRIYRGGNTKYSRAIALSGAAVSSSIGYHTFFAQAFMTTLLNVRLGLWMTSPRQYQLDVLKKYTKPYQIERRVFWPVYLWDEVRARVSARRPLINLTDGEHTGDNLAIFPLLQRRCKFIIAGDASADQAGTCTGLFRVLRMAEMLLGVKVKINVAGEQPAGYDAEKKEAGPAKHHFAVGEILYANGEQGWLVHFRPVVTKEDPGSILNYWDTHKSDFPHPSTADQFFDDEQYEVQRSLGEWTVEHTLRTLVTYYQGRLAAEQEKKRKNRARIKALSSKATLISKLLEKQELDFDLLHKHPGMLDDIFTDLYSVSNQKVTETATGK